MTTEQFKIKDSGKRQEFASGMVRDTTAGKILWHLVASGPMFKRWAVHLTNGAAKYNEDNWMRASSEEEYKRFKASAFRHFMQWWLGDRDEDHGAAVIFNINGAEYVKEKLDKKVEEKKNDGNVNILCANIRAVGEANRWSDWFTAGIIERVRTFDYANGDKWPGSRGPNATAAGFQAVQEADTAIRGCFEDREIGAAHGGVTGRGIAGSKIVDLAPSSTVRVGK